MPEQSFEFATARIPGYSTNFMTIIEKGGQEVIFSCSKDYKQYMCNYREQKKFSLQPTFNEMSLMNQTSNPALLSTQLPDQIFATYKGARSTQTNSGRQARNDRKLQLVELIFDTSV